jgi:multidrug efflux system outer membrane protein
MRPALRGDRAAHGTVGVPLANDPGQETVYAIGLPERTRAIPIKLAPPRMIRLAFPMPRFAALSIALAALVTAGCSGLRPSASSPQLPDSQSMVPQRWEAPLPHGGSVKDLSQWWREFGDPVLPALIDQAQAASPTLSGAAVRLEQARAERSANTAALIPALDAGASVSRGNAQFPLPLARTTGASLTASWEADVFDRNKFGVRGAQARFESAQAQWHDARVVIAAETALQYLALRHCEQVRAFLGEDTASLAALARLASLNARAGLIPQSQADLAQAELSTGQVRLQEQQTACSSETKALVALTGIAESTLRAQLDATAGRRLPPPPALLVEQLPATVILQRPDVVVAERELIASLSEFRQAQTARLPRIFLSGSIGVFSVRGREMSTDIDTWSLGPVRLQLPVFDGGVADAREAAAKARFDDSVVQLQARVRRAVQEVEDALLRADSVRLRLAQALLAHSLLEKSHRAIELRNSAGLVSRQELEASRRALIQSQLGLLGLERERWVAGISLYRAAGGGWRLPSESS